LPASGAQSLSAWAGQRSGEAVPPAAAAENLCRCLLRAALLRITAGSAERWDEMRLDEVAAAALGEWGVRGDDIALESRLLRIFSLGAEKVCAAIREWGRGRILAARATAVLVAEMMGQDLLRDFLQVNFHAGDEYFSKKRFCRFAGRLWPELERSMGPQGGAERSGAEEARELIAYLPMLAQQSLFKTKALSSFLRRFAGEN